MTNVSALSVLKFLIFNIVFVAAFCVASFSYAADVLLSPSTGSYSSGQTFTATVQVNPAGDSVNAVEAQLSFDTNVLSVVSVSKTGSVFSLWTTEPEFSNTAGTITFGGGSPTPFSNQSNLLVVTFRTLAEGMGTVSFDSASALAADGLGTDVLNNSISANYTVAATVEPEPVSEPVSDTPVDEVPAETTDNDNTIAFGEPPRAPVVGSSEFIDPDIWYATTSALFTWELPFDITAVALDVATSSDAVPSTIYEPPIEEIRLSGENLTEGVQYLSIQFENQVDWGVILNRKIQIDTEAPLPFDIAVQTGNAKTAFPLLTFGAKDSTSGIERYELTIANGEPVIITPDEAKLGYLLSKLEDGTYTVKVTAYDFAGNTTIASTPVLVTAGWLPEELTVEESSIWDFFTAKNILIIILILIIVAQFVYFMYERRRMARHEEILRKETKEIQDQMEKIFSALRDEIYDQINTITKRPRLSKKEREAVEELNNALEVSETLIEKEINDVKKILK